MNSSKRFNRFDLDHYLITDDKNNTKTDAKIKTYVCNRDTD